MVNILGKIKGFLGKWDLNRPVTCPVGPPAGGSFGADFDSVSSENKSQRTSGTSSQRSGNFGTGKITALTAIQRNRNSYITDSIELADFYRIREILTLQIKDTKRDIIKINDNRLRKVYSRMVQVKDCFMEKAKQGEK